MSSEQYMLWFMPDGDSRRSLQLIITQLAEAFGSPAFLPHCTLLSGLLGKQEELVARVQAFAERQPSLQVNVQHVEEGDSFYESVFLLLERSNPLLQIRKRAEEEFGIQQTSYMPHISLLYGEYDASTKATIVDGMQKFHYPRTISLHSLALVKGKVDGTTDSWKVIFECKLPA